MTKEMERLKEIEARKAELKTEAFAEGITEERLTEIKTEAADLKKEEEELRGKIELNNTLAPAAVPEAKTEERKTMTEMEQRAKTLTENGKMEVRALLSTGKIAEPTKVDGINGIAVEGNAIVDDVRAVALTGNGAYTVAYQVNAASAADVVDGNEIGGTEATFDYVTINPAEWGIVGSISKQVAKVSPLNYASELTKSALYALRAEADKKIVAAILKSKLAGAGALALNQDYLRTIVLANKSIDGKGGVKLYLNRNDLVTLGKVRGTDKKPVYAISFADDTAMEGTITEGGLAVAFAIDENLPVGTQLFGQPQTVEMPMWDNYAIETDESVYFTKNLIAYRGVQTANVDLCAINGMTKITQP